MARRSHHDSRTPLYEEDEEDDERYDSYWYENEYVEEGDEDYDDEEETIINESKQRNQQKTVPSKNKSKISLPDGDIPNKSEKRTNKKNESNSKDKSSKDYKSDNTSNTKIEKSNKSKEIQRDKKEFDKKDDKKEKQNNKIDKNIKDEKKDDKKTKKDDKGDKKDDKKTKKDDKNDKKDDRKNSKNDKKDNKNEFDEKQIDKKNKKEDKNDDKKDKKDDKKNKKEKPDDKKDKKEKSDDKKDDKNEKGGNKNDDKQTKSGNKKDDKKDKQDDKKDEKKSNGEDDDKKPKDDSKKKEKKGKKKDNDNEEPDKLEDEELNEEDEEMAKEIQAMIQQRRSSRLSTGKKRRNSKKRKQGDDENTQSPDDKEETTEEEIFENIQLQKEIIENLKKQPLPMRKKLKALHLAKQYVEKYEGRLSRSHGYQEEFLKAWRRFARWLDNLMTVLTPWEKRIKQIESHFGSVVASYFTFLRWIFWVNIIITVLMFSFVVIPEIISGAPFGTTFRKSVAAEEEETALSLKTVWDFEGYLRHSPIFYGYYSDHDTIGRGYKLPLAYFLTGLSIYGYSFFAILRKMAQNSRMSKLADKDEEYAFSWKLFTGWDYMIGNPETGDNRVASIATGFKESIMEEKEKTKDEKRYLTIFLRVLANIIVMILLSASAYAVYLVVDRSQHPEAKSGWWRQNEVSVVVSLITLIFPSLFDLIGIMENYHPRAQLRWQLARILVLYLLNLYTLIFALFLRVDEMSQQLKDLKANLTAQQAQAASSTMVSVASTAASSAITLSPPSTTFYYDFTNSSIDGNFTQLYNLSMILTTPCSENCLKPNLQEEIPAKHRIPNFHTENLPISERTLKTLCWETMVGQEIVKLTVMDLLITVFSILIIDFIRAVIVRFANRCCCWDLEKTFPEYGDFKIAENILHLVNNQGMIWMGTFFSPPLPGINMIKLLIMMYIRSWAVLVSNIPHERVFRASRSNNFYYTLLLVMLFLCTLPVGYTVVWMEPSWHCGPFSKYDKIYHILTSLMESSFPAILNKALDYIASPGIIIPFFLLMVLIIYYLSSVTNSLREANNDLKNQLHCERTEERRKVYAMAGVKKDKHGSGMDNMPTAEDKTNKLLNSKKHSSKISTDKMNGVKPPGKNKALVSNNNRTTNKTSLNSHAAQEPIKIQPVKVKTFHCAPFQSFAKEVKTNEDSGKQSDKKFATLQVSNLQAVTIEEEGQDNVPLVAWDEVENDIGMKKKKIAEVHGFNKKEPSKDFSKSGLNKESPLTISALIHRTSSIDSIKQSTFDVANRISYIDISDDEKSRNKKDYISLTIDDAELDEIDRLKQNAKRKEFPRNLTKLHKLPPRSSRL